MSKLKVKVCGMREPENIKAIADLRPDYMGFIFYQNSKRYVGKGFDLSWFDADKLGIKKVGVFVDEPTESIATKIAKYDLQVIQLHGDETADQCREFGQAYPQLEIRKAFGISESFDFKKIGEFSKYCSSFLFDSSSAELGGSGKVFDWSLLERYDNSLPLILAGGIDSGKIAEIKGLIKKGTLIGTVDINSKFEISPGLKSKEAVEEFIAKVRQ